MFVRLCSVAIALIVTAAPAYAQKFLIKETATRTIMCNTSGCEPEDIDGSFTVKGSYRITPDVSASFDGDTTFSLILGDFKFEAPIYTADDYVPGGTKATFNVRGFHPEDLKEFVPLRIKISWKGGKFRVLAKVYTPEYYGLGVGAEALAFPVGKNHHFVDFFGLDMQPTNLNGFALVGFDTPFNLTVKETVKAKGDVTTTQKKATAKATLVFN
jgi:hypothetical protein